MLEKNRISGSFSTSTVKMSIRTPPILLRLAGRSLLRDQPAAITALEYLPAEFFKLLFIQACRRRMWKPLKVLVQAWPFSVLPLGSLMRLPPVMVLKVVLEGLDGLLAQEVRLLQVPGRVLGIPETGWVRACEGLRVDLKFLTVPVRPREPLHTTKLTVGSRGLPMGQGHLQNLPCLLPVVLKGTRSAEQEGWRINHVSQRPVDLEESHEEEVEEEEEEEEEKMEEEEKEVQEEEEQEEQKEKKQALEEEYLWEREEEEQEWEDEEDWEREEQEWEREEQEEQRYFSQFFSQMLRLQHLKKLSLDSPSFLRDRLDQMLRCLQTPLDKLSIWLCWQLTRSDLTHLFQCPNLRQLKSLRLCGANLTDCSPEPLRGLEAVAPTLQDLRLDNCVMVDSQVEAILPVLSRCHQLRDFTITENPLSVATVEKLLHHTPGLRSLESERYPVPLECYRIHETVTRRVALIQAELMGTLRELGQPRTIHLDTKYFSSGDFYDMEPLMCPCNDPA
uniref:Uncharacterized protein n=1 Tax=Myotis lucifugus TaxID=59463 RepID=G1QBV8_MYOLU